MNCKVFGQHGADKECPAELESVSEYSPGIVLHEECLARLIFTPIHVDDETGEIKAAAFNDVKDKGLSVNRLEHISKSDLAQKGYAKAKADKTAGKEREFVGVIEALCSCVRSIRVEGQRSFCVADTALADNISHADICQIPLGNKERRSARTALMRVFSNKLIKSNGYI